MKLHARGGTKIGSLVLFWPELLPEDFDDRWDTEPNEVLKEVADAIYTIDLEAWAEFFPNEVDGEYSLTLYIDEAVPEELRNYCTLYGKYEELRIAGEGFFSGLEFIFRHDRSLLDRQPRMGSPLQIPAGTYSGEVFKTEVPAEVYESWLREQAGEGAQRLWWVQTWFASIGIVALAVFVGCLFFGTRETVIVSSVVSAVLLGIGWIMSRTAGYRRVQQARREYAAAYPDFVVRLRTLANQ
jgi:hypothetical protein